MDGGSDPIKMQRALAGELGQQLRKYLKSENIEDFLTDRTALTISDWETERLYRDLIIRNPSMKDAILPGWKTDRQEWMQEFLLHNKDSLSALALLFDNTTDTAQSNTMNVISFMYAIQKKGPDNQGDVIEILGPMRAGKTNFMVWLMLIARYNGIHVITNIPLKQEFENVVEVHKLSEVIIQMSVIRKNDPDAITWIMLDEQAGVKGSGSRTATTRETRWADNFIRLIGKFGASLWRARQFNDIIKEQMGLVSIQFVKSVDKLDSTVGEFKSGPYEGTLIYFDKIKNESDKYDTRSMSSFSIDIDMEIFNAKFSNVEADISKGETTQEDAIIEIVKKMLASGKTKTHEKVCELKSKGVAEKDIAEITGYSLKQVYNILEAEFY